MKSNSLWIALALASAASASAAPALNTYTYSVRIPASGTTCEGAAQNLATFFQASAPKVRVIKSQCVTRASFMESGERFTVDNIKVTYESESPIFFTSVRIPGDDFHSYLAYPKYSDCLNDLGQQSHLFAQATGLSPISASCVPGFDPAYGYTLKIDSIGKPARTLSMMHNLAFERMEMSPAWKQQIIEFIGRAGGIVAKVSNESIAYYGTMTLSIGTKSWYHTDTLEQCQAQADEITSILSKLGAKNSLAVCHPDADLNAHVTTHYYMDTVFDSAITSYFPAVSNENFFTFDECMAVRASMYPVGHAPLGSFCSISDLGENRYSLTSITRF